MECQQGFERCSNVDKDFRRKIAISAGVRYFLGKGNEAKPVRYANSQRTTW